MTQLNQVAQAGGLSGTGIDGKINLIGAVFPTDPLKGELAHRRRAKKIQGQKLLNYIPNKHLKKFTPLSNDVFKSN